MINWKSSNTVDELSLEQIKEELEKRIHDLAAASTQLIKEEIFRIELPIEEIDALVWLKNQKSDTKVYWYEHNLFFEFAGSGIADTIHTSKIKSYPQLFQRIRKYLSPKNPNIKYFGGISFNPNVEVNGDWCLFGAAYFVLPRFDIQRINGKLYFGFNFKVEELRSDTLHLSQEIENLSTSTIEFSPLETSLLNRKYYPEQNQWFEMTDSALRLIKNTTFEKIVLSRQAEFEFISDLDGLTVLNNLKTLNRESIYFSIQPDSQTSLIGGTPELLYRRNGRQIYSEAIAGTRPRGLNEREDELLEKDLLSSKKDKQEHWFVMQSVKEILGGICTKLEFDDKVSVLKLAHLQHLYSNIRGILKAHVNDADIISKLHPTPAVGGYPKGKALKHINELELFERGWYAAPIGWISFDAAEFAVAIRSGLINRNKLFLFSGAGIVAGSIPHMEWEEIENKIGNFMKVLNIDGHSSSKYKQPMGIFDHRGTD